MFSAGGPSAGIGKKESHNSEGVEPLYHKRKELFHLPSASADGARELKKFGALAPLPGPFSGLKPHLFLGLFHPSAKADGKAKQSNAMQCKAMQGKARQGKAMLCKARQANPTLTCFACLWLCPFPLMLFAR